MFKKFLFIAGLGIISSNCFAIEKFQENLEFFSNVAVEKLQTGLDYASKSTDTFFSMIKTGSKNLLFDVESNSLRRGFAFSEIAAFSVLLAKVSERLSFLKSFLLGTTAQYFIMNKMKGQKFLSFDKMQLSCAACLAFSAVTVSNIIQIFTDKSKQESAEKESKK